MDNHDMKKQNLEARIQSSSQFIDQWISWIDDWDKPGHNSWTYKDLLGHLTVWSELLLEQIDAILSGDGSRIKRINVDQWNAMQIRRYNSWRAEEINSAWRKTSRQAALLLSTLKEEQLHLNASVSWSQRPVSIGDLYGLWLEHIEQHKSDFC